MIHGSLPTSACESGRSSVSASSSDLPIALVRALTGQSRPLDSRLSNNVMAGALSIRLLQCFFATAHMHVPVVDFYQFSHTFNAANGDPRIMSVMNNGGDLEEGIPSAVPKGHGLGDIQWPGTKISKIGNPGSSEALVAAMHAWAALFTDAPIAFGSEAARLGLPGVPSSDRFTTLSETIGADAVGTTGGGAKRTSVRRPKRKQGVACDTCRLRRVRCDLTERPQGTGCSRCEDKRIVCTDEYIQAKLKKAQLSGKKPDAECKVAATAAEPCSSSSSSAPELLSWPNGSTSTKRSSGSSSSGEQRWDSRESLSRIYRTDDKDYSLRWGRARKAFCQQLLDHALALAHKHDLLTKPSLEAIQVLSLLAPLLELEDPKHAMVLQSAACSHLMELKLETKYRVDENDRQDVEKLLTRMQHRRVYFSAWCRDAISAGMTRREPFFRHERAIEVQSSGGGGGGGGGGGDGRGHGSSPSASREDKAKDGSHGRKLEAKAITSGGSDPGASDVALSGEMGLTFTIMALMQVGALSRFVAKHIDNVRGFQPAEPSWQKPARFALKPPTEQPRFSPRPSGSEIRKLEKACTAVWQSIDSLLLFFDRCIVTARENMENLHPFQPLGWIASTRICGSLLNLIIFRVIAERYRTNAAYISAMTEANAAVAARGGGGGGGGEVDGRGRRSTMLLSDEDVTVARNLRNLFEKSKSKTLTSCRKTARLIEYLLPRGTFVTGGIVLRQIFPIAQFLAKMPCEQGVGGGGVADTTLLIRQGNDHQSRGGLDASHANRASPPPFPTPPPIPSSHNPNNETPSRVDEGRRGTSTVDFVDPRRLSQTQPTTHSSYLLTDPNEAREEVERSWSQSDDEEEEEEEEDQVLEGQAEHKDQPIIPVALFHSAQLGPFDQRAKRREVSSCTQAIVQMGFAYDSVAREIEAIDEIMKSNPSS
ncbi:hypothetical protein IE53DRAFT_383434 [Violaceomyces palustris]|uniref:Uncharacterized protein n=1 Tax=Violaceomyces palustris TaxID=1673888 RepID=A0ACD0P7I5_9BASI|nr:hypothetical protein IE53DRAFT_383434 [Violaceomyces palustris]